LQSFDEAHKNVIELVGRFGQNLSAYKDGSYNETQVRLEFINPFFEALGWDVRNEGGYAEQYKDVVHEDAVKVGVSTKAPDYSFRIGGQRKFFLEAKKPSVNIKGDPAPAYQLRRYGWSAKLPLSILTDFEEFAVYECMRSPSPKDAPAVGRVEYYTFDQYPEKFQEIYDKFGKDAVLKGSFDRYAAGAKGKRGTAAVDSEFLKVIEGWRLVLAKELAKRNPSLGIHELNFSVQQSIDRIVFLRIAEDRGVEKYGALQALTNGTNVYRRLLQLYDTADRKYNSGLFDFKSDTLSHTLSVDDKVLKDIIAGLYYPSPYEFSVIGPEILGDVYEQFLGKVIRMTPARTVKVEDKPEVKKAGGVYYTPGFVVDYIVKNTVGKWLTGKKPKQAEALKVLDPACGSGSFLLRAYQYLLDWHLDYYVADGPDKYAKGKAPALYRAQGGVWRLTTTEKKRILLNNVFGVDIDRQAVEVTKLSLLLKVLEGETQRDFIGERLLPSLEGNVKCGNSLVGYDFNTDRTVDIFDTEELYRINTFDWVAAFPVIIGAGGFDCVIGNPPYVRQEMLSEFKPYFKSHYQTYNGTADLFVYFIEKGVSLLREGGLFGIICSNKWMRAGYGVTLRRWLKEKKIQEIIDFGGLPVFQKATTYPCIMLVNNDKAGETFLASKVITLSFASLDEYLADARYEVSQEGLEETGWSTTDYESVALMEKIKSRGVPLNDYVDGKIYRGVLTGLNEAFVIDEETKARLIKEDPNSEELIKPFLVGKDIRRYSLLDNKRHVIFTRRGIDIKKYPAVLSHLKQFKIKLTPKPKDWKGEKWPGRKPGSYKWYEIQDAVDYYAEFEKPKILWPGISSEVTAFSLDENGFYGNDNNQLIISDDKYLLGILNSRIARFFLVNICDKVQGGFYRLKIVYVQPLPIRPIDFTDKKDAARHDRMVGLVTRMLELNKKLASSSTPADKDLYKRQVDATDKEIDALVYELYGLTKEEIKVVEG